MQKLPSWITQIGRLLTGAPRCALCHESAHTDALCAGCRADLDLLFTDTAHRCPACTRFSLNAMLCGQCQQKPPPFRCLHASCYYEAPLKQMLHAFKYHSQTALLPTLAALIRQHPPPWLLEQHIDAVLAMPLSRARLHRRGFNQSALLAQPLAAEYGWPLLDKHTVLRHHRPPQSTLTRAQRHRNVHGVFRVRANVKNRNLLLIDDVVTTGATVSELAQSLKRAGAAAVYVWVLAHPQ